MYRLNIKNCKTCKQFYRDGNYNPHCKKFINQIMKSELFDNCINWEEKKFSGIFDFITPDRTTIKY